MPDGRRLVTTGGCGEWFPADCSKGSDQVPVPREISARFFKAKQAAENVKSNGRAELAARIAELAAVRLRSLPSTDKS
jgi:hypothetical protein